MMAFAWLARIKWFEMMGKVHDQIIMPFQSFKTVKNLFRLVTTACSHESKNKDSSIVRFVVAVSCIVLFRVPFSISRQRDTL